MPASLNGQRTAKPRCAVTAWHGVRPLVGGPTVQRRAGEATRVCRDVLPHPMAPWWPPTPWGHLSYGAMLEFPLFSTRCMHACYSICPPIRAARGLCEVQNLASQNPTNVKQSASPHPGPHVATSTDRGGKCKSMSINGLRLAIYFTQTHKCPLVYILPKLGLFRKYFA